MITAGKVYSYLRFSAAKQAAGASAARQSDYAKKWAAEHGMILDAELSMRDEGLSAYHQRHIKTGALGVFLAAINAGKIPAGSVLIVEGLDRLSRAEPIQAQAQLAQIINAEITVITASDGKQYNRERLKANPMDLVYSLLVMVRAHEESETKSKRVADVLRRKCEGWTAGTYRGKISCGADPSWVRWTGSAFELIPEAANAVCLAVRMFTEGYGAVKILQLLNDKGLSVTGGRHAGNINQLITAQPHLFIGDRIVNASGTPYTLKGYYPALLNQAEYDRLVVAIAERKTKPRKAGGKSEYPSLFTGMGMATCGHCGGALVSSNQTRQAPYKGPRPIYRRVKCLACETAAGKVRKTTAGAAFNLEYVERAILDFCSDQFNLDGLLAGDGRQDALRAERAAVRAKIVGLEAKVSKFLDAAFDTDEGLPQSIITRVREMEQQLAREKSREQTIAAELATKANRQVNASAQAWRELRDGVLSLDYDSRQKARQLVAETLRHVQIDFTGAGTVDILLLPHSGAARRLTLDRKSGEWLAAERDGMRAEIVTDSEAVTVAVARIPKLH